MADGLLGILFERLGERHDKNIQFEREKRLFHQQASLDPNRSEEERAMHEQAYIDMLGPEAKKAHRQTAPVLKGLGKLAEVLGLRGKQAEQMPDGEAPAQVPAKAPAQVSAATYQPPTETDPESGMPSTTEVARIEPPVTAAIKRQFNSGPGGLNRTFGGAIESATKQKQAEMDLLRQQFNDAVARGEITKEQAQAGIARTLAGGALPVAQRPALIQGKIKLQDGTEVEGVWDKNTNSYFDVSNNPITGVESFTEKVKGGRAVNLSGILAPDAIEALAAQGQEFKDQAGNPYDVALLKSENLGLKAVTLPGGEVFYMPTSLEEVTTDVGGGRFATDRYSRRKIPVIGAEQVTFLGQAQPNTNTSRQETAVDPATGQLTTNTLRGGTTRQMTGPAAAAAAAATAAASPAPAPAPAATTPAARVAQPKAAPGTAPTATPAAPGNIRGISPAQYAQWVDRAGPVKVGISEIFSDPANPDFKGLDSFVDLADNPESRKRLAKAIPWVIKSIEDGDESGSGVHVGTGPISVSSGGFGTVLQNVFGVPQKIAEQQGAQYAEMVGSLPPREQQYVNALASSLSVLVGLRKLTGASGAKFSVKAIERDAPIIGMNVQNSQSFADKMSRIARMAWQGAQMAPSGFFKPEELKRMQDTMNSFARQAEGKPPETKRVREFGPGQGPGGAKPKTAEELFQSLTKQ